MTGLQTAKTVTERNRAILSEFSGIFYGERDVRRAFEQFVAEDYIQHNASINDGRDAAIEFLGGMFGAPGSTFEVLRIIVDENLAAVHVRATPAGRGLLSVIDLYRLEDGQIVEHWDVVTPVPADAVSDHPMF